MLKVVKLGFTANILIALRSRQWVTSEADLKPTHLAAGPRLEGQRLQALRLWASLDGP